jgi:hydroxymethylbilane synthase
MSLPLSIATRGSPLALAQANAVLAQCRAAFPSQKFELKIIKTTGDKMQAASLAGAELPKGLFTKEIEEALLAGEADLAVHSLKDLPTELPAGLKLGAVGKRADVRDVLIYRDAAFTPHAPRPTPDWSPGQKAAHEPRGFKRGLTIAKLPPGATVATSSTRRAAQVRERRPDVNLVPIRGNVGTRLKKIADQGELDATILAAAGLARLGFVIFPDGRLKGQDVPAGLLAAPIEVEEMLPCVGQAAIGIEIRAADERLEKICAALDHFPTRQAVTAERAFLSGMGGGCQLAVAAYAELLGHELRLRAVSFLGGQPKRSEARRVVPEAVQLGAQLAAELKQIAPG